ncbi:hypothetical protein CcrC1_gp252c [Caulobacter phage C1]|nr:hypothetical protein CcrC1_gp252c [Caulobacter phage C1]UTU08481.1 hypothetical protein CcrC2_gp253c [Caulobacter phage C2]UTU08996.1 hypothetical protein CcrJ4_gp247c [Caulobacter phage J4]UTU10114.1 hypothetical protein CcrRB23_gp252c [Caulobacter phage RB23]WGN97149.1 hypothetical protein [Bertelyvirus sp.]
MTPQFEAFLRQSGYVLFEDMGNGMWVGIKRLMFHWTMHVGALDDYLEYDDRWCYETEASARAGLSAWKAQNYAGEPSGWHRHPKTSRRREGGDPSKEEIRP